ncbi:hypothetical protein SHLI107390_05300 [Shewanella livingstonensis]
MLIMIMQWELYLDEHKLKTTSGFNSYTTMAYRFNSAITFIDTRELIVIRY